MKKQDAPIRTPATGACSLWSGGSRAISRKVNVALICWLTEIAPSPGPSKWFGRDSERYREFAPQSESGRTSWRWLSVSVTPVILVRHGHVEGIGPRI
jgi:hypothetical protein